MKTLQILTLLCLTACVSTHKTVVQPMQPQVKHVEPYLTTEYRKAHHLTTQIK